MTLAGEMEYYNGLVFQGYLKALPRPLLKGGRYDLLMQKFTPGAGAIGFAVYLDELDRLSAPLPPVQKNSTDRVMLNVALPKGRLGDKVYHLLAGIGYGCPEDYNATRKLVVENPEAGIRYFLVKPSDVAIYVEHGAADVGIVGKDILTEASADVYELLDTCLLYTSKHARKSRWGQAFSTKGVVLKSRIHNKDQVVLLQDVYKRQVAGHHRQRSGCRVR